jgi:phosphonopyruvate decarboxylase
MICPNEFLKFLKKKKITFFTGVPDSVLEDFLEKVSKLKKTNHVETFNEGSAVSLAIGYNLATKKIPCVYLQNSGLGNAINPLVSIAHQKVYSVPLILLIGWRGSPFVRADEPQHNVKGKITRDILKLLGIKFLTIRSKKIFPKISKLIDFAKKKSRPVALLVEKNILKSNTLVKKKMAFKNGVKRQIVIEELLKNIRKDTKIISTTGYTSRELFQIRKNKNLKAGKDFYMVGGMGHSLMVSLGHSLNLSSEVICLDGDGALLMHLGSLRTSGIFGKKNLKHIIFNNYCHESVGGQRTFSEDISFSKLAKELGYNKVFKINNYSDVKIIILKFIKSKGPSLLEVITKVGTINNLKRPNDFIKIKKKFIN